MSLEKNEKMLDNHYRAMFDLEWDKDNFNDYQRLEDFISENKINSIVEIGCGAGCWYENFGQNLKVKYTGLDISEVAIKICRDKFPSADFRHWIMYDNIIKETNYASAKSESVEDIKADLTFSRHCFIHNRDLRKFIQNTLDFSPTVIHMGNYHPLDHTYGRDEAPFKHNGGIHDNYSGLTNPYEILVDWKYSKEVLLEGAKNDKWESKIDSNWLLMEEIR